MPKSAMTPLSLGVLLLAGCASTVPYEPKDRVLSEVAPAEARARFGQVVSRSVDPVVVSVDVGSEALEYRYRRVVHGPFGIPIGTVEREQTIPYTRVRRCRVYDNHRVYVYGERLMTKLLFDDAADARSFVDLLMSFRRSRLFGDGGEPER